MSEKKISLLIFLNLAAIGVALLIFQLGNFDVEIQNHFFDFETKTWLVDRDELVKKIIFYKFPKILLGLAILSCLGLAIAGFKKKSEFFFQNRHKFFLIFLGFVLIPLIAGNIKKFTNSYCPNQLTLYGGDKPYVKIFDSYPKDFVQEKRGQCFPAGHAVTGFALFILFFVAEKKSQKIAAFFAAFFLGSILGAYQILKGAHFLSDTVVAMLVCFLIASLIAFFYQTWLAKRSKTY